MQDTPLTAKERPMTAAATITRKTDDPRYIPGISEFDDDCTDQEWFDAMGPAPDPDASDEDLGPVCEDCLKYLPDAQIATKDPRILCEDCQPPPNCPTLPLGASLEGQR